MTIIMKLVTIVLMMTVIGRRMKIIIIGMIILTVNITTFSLMVRVVYSTRIASSALSASSTGQQRPKGNVTNASPQPLSRLL